MDSEPIPEKKIDIATGQNTEQVPTQTEEQSLSEEIVKNIPIAEDIARFRTELEQKMLWEGLPFKKWRQVYSQTLQEYPQIKEYKPILDVVMEEVEHSRNRLNEAWKEAHPNTKEFKEDEDKFVPQTADPEAAKSLFIKQFGFEPEKSVEAIRGAISLRFIIEDEDFKKIWGDKGELPEAQMTLDTNKDFSVLLMRRRILDELPPHEGLLTLMHETQHTKNELTQRVRDMYLDPLDLRFPEKIVDRLQRKYKKEPEIEKSAKNEIVSLFTILEWLDFQGVNLSGKDEKEYSDSLSKRIDYMKVELSKKLFQEEGDYFEIHKKWHEPTHTEQNRYSEVSEHGINSLTELYKLYRESEYKQKAGAMTLNVLEQFPLYLWPAVVRLIEKRHSQKTEQ